MYKKDKKVNEPEHQELVVVRPGRTSHIVPLSRKTGVPRSCDPDNWHGWWWAVKYGFNINMYVLRLITDDTDYSSSNDTSKNYKNY